MLGRAYAVVNIRWPGLVRDVEFLARRIVADRFNVGGADGGVGVGVGEGQSTLRAHSNFPFAAFGIELTNGSNGLPSRR